MNSPIETEMRKADADEIEDALASKPAGDVPPKRSFRETLVRLGPAAPIAIAVTIVPPLGSAALITIIATTNLAPWMRDHPTTALPIYTFAFWFLGLFALPTYAYSMLGGWAFGFTAGLIATTIAYSGACCGAYAIARWVARDRVVPLIDEHPRLAKIRQILAGASFWKSFIIIALLRISPVSPFAITNVVLGAGGVPWSPFALGSACGVIPRTAAVVWIASGLSELPFKSGIGFWILGGGIVLAIIILFITSRLARAELDRQLTGHRPRV